MSQGRRFLQLALLLALALPAAPAHAYPWLIRDGYTNCSGCHVDPSGWGLLTEYGRSQAQIVLPTLWGKKQEDVEPTPGIAYGAVPLPSWLNVGLSLRGAVLSTTTFGITTPAGQTTQTDTTWRDILMIADLRAGVTAGPFLASVSIGYVPTGARLAALTDQPRDNIVSREHWLGVRLLDNRLYLLGGRMDLPFGLRNVEHNSLVRSSTRTDTDSYQQYGGQVVWDGPNIRAAVMGIAGNFVSAVPADYREQGYAGYVEGAFSQSFTLGLSSLATHANLGLGSISNPVIKDPFANASDVWRQAHGLFSRWAIDGPWVLLAEADLLGQSASGVPRDWGGTGFLQADYQVLQGLHLFFTAEALRQYEVTSYGGWFTVDWFFFPGCEARLDMTFIEYGIQGGGHEPTFSVLGQLHFSM